MATVEQLNVPPPTYGQDALAHSLRGNEAAKTYRAQVLNATPDAKGRIRVLVDDAATSAKLSTTVKSVKNGDSVRVEKRGGAWRVVASETYRTPPQVSGSMGNRPPNAATSSSYDATLSLPPNPPSDPSGSTNNQLYTRMLDITAHLRRVRLWQMETRNLYHGLRNSHNSMGSTVNTNASRLNSTRDYAGNAGQLVEPVVDALRDERIVR